MSVSIIDATTHFKILYEDSGTESFFSKTGLVIQKEDHDNFFIKSGDSIRYLSHSQIKEPLYGSLDELISFFLTSARIPLPPIENNLTEYLSVSFPRSADEATISVSSDIPTNLLFSLKIHKALLMNNIKFLNIELVKKNTFGLCKYKLIKNARPFVYKENSVSVEREYEPPRGRYVDHSKLEVYYPGSYPSMELYDFHTVRKESKVLMSGFLDTSKTLDLIDIVPSLYTVTSLTEHPTDYEYLSLFLEYVNSNTEVFGSLNWTEETQVSDVHLPAINEALYGVVRDIDVSESTTLTPKTISDVSTLKKSAVMMISQSVVINGTERNAVFAYGIDGSYIAHYVFMDEDFTSGVKVNKVSDNVFVLENSSSRQLYFFQINLNLKTIALKYTVDASTTVNELDVTGHQSMKFIEVDLNDYFGLYFKMSNTSFKYVLLRYSNTQVQMVSYIADDSVQQFMTSGYAYGQLGFMVHSSQGDGNVRHFLKFYGFDMQYYKFKRPVQQTLSFGGYYPDTASLLNMNFNNLFCVKAGGYQHSGSSVYQSSIVFYDTSSSTKLGEYVIDKSAHPELFASTLLTEVQGGYVVSQFNNSELFSVKIDQPNGNAVNLSKTGISSITPSYPSIIKILDDTSDDITKEHQLAIVSNLSTLQPDNVFEWTFEDANSLIDRFGNEFISTSPSYSFDASGLVTTSALKLQHTPIDYSVFQNLSNNWRQKIRLTIPSSSSASKFQTKFENADNYRGFHVSMHNNTLQFAGLVRLEDGNSNQLLFFRSYDASGVSGGLFGVEHEFEFSYEGIPLGSDPADPNRYARTKILVDGIEVVTFNNNSRGPYTTTQVETGVYIPTVGHYEVDLPIPGTKIKSFSIGTHNLLDFSHKMRVDYVDTLDLKDGMFNIKSYLPSFNNLKLMTGSETFVMNSPMPTAADHMQNSNDSWKMILEFTGASSTQSIFFGTGTDTATHHVDYGGWYLSINPSFVRLHRYVYFDSPHGSAGKYFEFNEGASQPATNWPLMETTPLFDETDIVRVEISYDKSTNQLTGSFIINEEVHTQFTPTSQISIGYNQQGTTPYYLKYTGTSTVTFNKVIIYK